MSDLASRLASRPARSKAAPTSYAGMDLSGDEEEEEEKEVDEGSKVKGGSKVKFAARKEEEGDVDYVEHISIPDSDSGDDFIAPAKKPKVSSIG